jgi:hypothetical protein
MAGIPPVLIVQSHAPPPAALAAPNRASFDTGQVRVDHHILMIRLPRRWPDGEAWMRAHRCCLVPALVSRLQGAQTVLAEASGRPSQIGTNYYRPGRGVEAIALAASAGEGKPTAS